MPLVHAERPLLSSIDSGPTTLRQFAFDFLNIQQPSQRPHSKAFQRSAIAFQFVLVAFVLVNIAFACVDSGRDSHAFLHYAAPKCLIASSVVLTAEYGTQFWCCVEAGVPVEIELVYSQCLTRWMFFISPLNLLDLVTLISFWAMLSMPTYSHAAGGVTVLRFGRLARMARLARTTRICRGLRSCRLALLTCRLSLSSRQAQDEREEQSGVPLDKDLAFKAQDHTFCGRLRVSIFDFLHPHEDSMRSLTFRKCSGCFQVLVVGLIAANLLVMALQQTVPEFQDYWTSSCNNTLAMVTCLVFTAEYVARLWTCSIGSPQQACRARAEFFVNPMNLLDFITVLSLWMTLLAPLLVHHPDPGIANAASVGRAARAGQVTRIAKVGQAARIGAMNMGSHAMGRGQLMHIAPPHVPMAPARATTSSQQHLPSVRGVAQQCGKLKPQNAAAQSHPKHPDSESSMADEVRQLRQEMSVLMERVAILEADRACDGASACSDK